MQRAIGLHEQNNNEVYHEVIANIKSSSSSYPWTDCVYHHECFKKFTNVVRIDGCVDSQLVAILLIFLQKFSHTVLKMAKIWEFLDISAYVTSQKLYSSD